MGTREQITFSSLRFLRGVEAVSGEEVSNRFGRHIHATFILGKVTKGERVIAHGGSETRVSRGECFFLNPGQVHACRPGEEGVHSYQLLSIGPQVFTRIASEISERAETAVWFDAVTGGHGGLSRGLSDFFGMLSDPMASAFDKESHLYGLLAEALLLFSRNPPEVCGVGCQDVSMARVRRHIQSHYSEHLTLASLASVACLSPFHFQRLFTRRYGISPHDYLIHTRVSEAKKVVLQGGNIAEAALATGFFDQSHLTRHFKKVVGTTPGRLIASSGVSAGKAGNVSGENSDSDHRKKSPAKG